MTNSIFSKSQWLEEEKNRIAENIKNKKTELSIFEAESGTILEGVSKTVFGILEAVQDETALFNELLSYKNRLVDELKENFSSILLEGREPKDEEELKGLIVIQTKLVILQDFFNSFYKEGGRDEEESKSE